METNPFILEDSEPDKSKDVSNLDETPQWPVKNPSGFLGEFGQGDKRHREGKSEEELKMYGGHRGTDVAAEKGTPVYPMLSGIVKKVYKTYKGDTQKQGNMIVVDHPDFGVVTKYMHLDTVSASPGQEVTQNTQIGTVGATGNAKGTPPHVHFELEKNGTSINARTYIEGKKTLEKKLATTRNIRKKILNEIIKKANKAWEDED